MSKRSGSAKAPAFDGLAPVLKLPPDLALPAIRVLARETDPSRRREQLVRLRSRIPERTLLNAYVLPSLKELGLYSGTLRDGAVTRFGRAVANATDTETANELVARQLVDVDKDRVGFVEWLLTHKANTKNQVRRQIFVDFVREMTGKDYDQVDSLKLDRLGKWVGYLVFYGVVRGDATPGATSGLTADPRHVQALSVQPGSTPIGAALRDAILEAYAQSTRIVGSRLYIPIGLLRDEIGTRLAASGVLLTDPQIDEILKKAPHHLRQYTVTFSPFSGPSRGGLKLSTMYAGFVSIRQKSGDASKL